MNDCGCWASGVTSNVEDLLPFQQFPFMEPSLEKPKRVVSLPPRPIVLSTKRLFMWSALVPWVSPSENDAAPHMKLPKMSLSFTTQSSEPNRITPTPVG